MNDPTTQNIHDVVNMLERTYHMNVRLKGNTLSLIHSWRDISKMSGLLKFITCGSVDDGKSTLIGHILYDAKLLYADPVSYTHLDVYKRQILM